jgi:hypothetical protein
MGSGKAGMKIRIDLGRTQARLTLERSELRLLRYALERASFIDTPPSEQLAIATFCSKALDLLPAPERPATPAAGLDATPRGSGSCAD